MKLDTNYLRKLTYVEKNLKDIEIEISADLDAEENDDEQGCGISIKGDKPLTENALKQLCSYLKIPYPFTKQLRAQGRTNVLSYVQRQLSQAAQSSVIFVSGATSIISITDDEKVHYKASELITIDQRLRDTLTSSDLELKDVICEKGLIHYFVFFKTVSDDVEDESKWRWGFIITFSALGEMKPSIGVVVQRLSDVSMAILPAKTHSYPLDYESEMEDRWNALESFIRNPPAPGWMTLEAAVTKLKKTIASFREVKETRSKLGKLKVDKEDTETLERLNTALQTKRINKAYALKELDFKPTKTWFSRATTPLTLFEVFNCVTREATAAPNTVSFEIRKNLYSHAGNLLMGSPDLYMLPPMIDWSRE